MLMYENIAKEVVLPVFLNKEVNVCKPPLQAIPVSGPFSCVGVDVLKLPQTYDGNQFVVVFADYLTK